MTDTEILKKAIEKAVKNGWKGAPTNSDPFSGKKIKPFDKNYSVSTHFAPMWIFSHDFAKAFWGEEDVCDDCGENANKNYEGGVCRNCNKDSSFDSNGFGDMSSSPVWQYHLQQMVLEENPIKYLAKFL
jgi:hypothetical protein